MAHEVSGIEKLVCDEIARRQQLGLCKYGTSVEANPLDLRAWLVHLLDEQLDAAIYTRRAIAEIDQQQEQGNGKGNLDT